MSDIEQIFGDPRLYIETFLDVRTKDKKRVPFKINKAQSKFLDEVTLRMIILKARQMGVSTISLAYMYVQTITQQSVTTLLVAHNKATAKEFLETIKMFYKATPKEFRPAVSNDNMYEFSFPDLGSKILVVSPTKDLGRGMTVNYAHLSELPIWKTPTESMTSLEEAVPDSGMIIIEGTPNGTGNLYHEMWVKALDEEASDWNGYHALQLPASLEYSEEWLARKLKKIGKRRYAQEYGLDFLQSGLPVFEEQYLAIQRERIEDGTVKELGPTCKMCNEEHAVDKQYDHEFMTRHYLHGVDVAEGAVTGDYDVHVVFDRDTGNEVFCLRGKWPIDVFAQRVNEIANKYPGVVGVERNNHGHGVLMRLRDLDTPGLYRGDDGKDGWLTNVPNKRTMIDELEEAIRNDRIHVGSLQALDEFRDYQQLDRKRTGAPSGKHDDHVMARAIAWQMRRRNSEAIIITG